MTDDEIDLTDDEFWAHLLGDDDPCAPGKCWAQTAFTDWPGGDLS